LVFVHDCRGGHPLARDGVHRLPDLVRVICNLRGAARASWRAGYMYDVACAPNQTSRRRSDGRADAFLGKLLSAHLYSRPKSVPRMKYSPVGYRRTLMADKITSRDSFGQAEVSLDSLVNTSAWLGAFCCLCFVWSCQTVSWREAFDRHQITYIPSPLSML